MGPDAMILVFLMLSFKPSIFFGVQYEFSLLSLAIALQVPIKTESFGIVLCGP